jgi:hypothetical protein
MSCFVTETPTRFLFLRRSEKNCFDLRFGKRSAPSKFLNGGSSVGILQIAISLFGIFAATVFGYSLYDSRLRKVFIRRLDSLQQQ